LPVCKLAALSLQRHPDTASFIQSFSGSHHFVLDYLLEEVLQRQSEKVQTFLLRTSILDRLCGPLCDAVLGESAGSAQSTLEFLERANLFLVPLDANRQWYRYHHLFADLLRQRLASAHDATGLHRRASQWYEEHGLAIEAFQHAAAANDVERAERLIEGHVVALQFRGFGAEGLSNREIGERLFLALDTVKGHNRKIFGKLQVQRRTEAVARARELGLA
jgi:LuxR family transcriptional regulator, maltose regulon positive regulatory protein